MASTGEYPAELNNEEHTHDFGFSALVLGGQLRLTTVEGAKTLNPGDTWALEAEVPHSEQVIGDEPVRFMYGLKT